MMSLSYALGFSLKAHCPRFTPLNNNNEYKGSTCTPPLSFRFQNTLDYYIQPKQATAELNRGQSSSTYHAVCILRKTGVSIIMQYTPDASGPVENAQAWNMQIYN
jgi:hypothetical protein